MRRPVLLASIAGATLTLVAAVGIIIVAAGDKAPTTRPRASGPKEAVPPPDSGSSESDAFPLNLPPLPSPIPAAAYTMHGLPLPAKAPTDERAKGPIIAIGTMQIPSIKVSHTIYEGVTLTVVDHGPGHWPGSAMPGNRGNTVFAGHRTTNDKPFADLDLVKVGDKVVFDVGGRTATYEVTKNFVVDGSNTEIALPTPDATMTLFACHPKGSAKQRIVLQGKLIATTPS